MKHTPIVQLGQAVLRRRAKPVTAMSRPELAQLIKEMVRRMRATGGVGIAAPQIGRSLRLFVIASQPNRRYPRAPRMRPLALINPRLVGHSSSRKLGWEGCLSIPGIRGQVPRYKFIQVAYTTISGERKTAVLKDFVARIFQHEFDHINGKVFLDRVADRRTLVTEQEYLKLFRAPRRSR